MNEANQITQEKQDNYFGDRQLLLVVVGVIILMIVASTALAVLVIRGNHSPSHSDAANVVEIVQLANDTLKLDSFISAETIEALAAASYELRVMGASFLKGSAAEEAQVDSFMTAMSERHRLVLRG